MSFGENNRWADYKQPTTTAEVAETVADNFKPQNTVEFFGGMIIIVFCILFALKMYLDYKSDNNGNSLDKRVTLVEGEQCHLKDKFATLEKNIDQNFDRLHNAINNLSKS